MASRSPSRGRYRSRTRSPTPRSEYSRSPQRRHRHDSRSPARSPSPPRRNGRYRSRSRSRTRSWSRGRDRGRDDRDRSGSPPPKSTKIVVERLSKNINEQHLYEIFGHFGRIRDLDLPINRTFGTNRGTAYILFDYEADAEAAIAHMHEAQVDGATINVSIVLPRRKLSPAPPTARRGANIDPRVPFAGPRGGPPGMGARGDAGMGGGGGRRRMSPGDRRPGHLPREAVGVGTAADPITLIHPNHAPGLQAPDGGGVVATTVTTRDGAPTAAAATVIEVDLAVAVADPDDRRVPSCIPVASDWRSEKEI
ncbi:hypothetical protein ACJZ2D_002758 [Fusarium nematophilum]